ncbi:hypothetical protein ACFZA2_02035 [Microbacterium sp. NPDC007973]|uniref:hypothetical protein n=1 Tax=Microbacterium sp. NPDC007973 TaxID=3364182 RepID=UPI0036E079A1
MNDAPKLDKLAYSLEEFAEAVSLSYAQILRHIANDELIAKYSGRKALILRAEGERFLRALPEARAPKVRS